MLPQGNSSEVNSDGLDFQKQFNDHNVLLHEKRIMKAYHEKV